MARAKLKFGAGTTQEIRSKIFRILDRNRGIAQFIADWMIDLVRSGKKPSGGKLKELEKSTIRGREYLAKYNQTHPDFSPSKSNLTFTGQFLDSFKSILKITPRSATIEVSPTGTHKPYKNKKGKNIAKAMSNKKLAGHLKDIGFNVIDWKLTDRQAKQLAARITDIIRSGLK